ncbi:protein translocase subunit SecF [Veillonella magna]|mgnify:CR=1 FL=1|jgi:preprotein translocase subunit SecF|uniref:Protein-export membrane protein SecF n=1 Tax=Veillonella magna TaxID=464322 RepID=A0ABS2GG10_9FIRM|nr:protein translocase subunit SecF [Veillonella magna]MBD8976274.1 protein translocase subunit SecF [Veillonella magna]MBM6823801.1 protein translocase subunit SecF [Veillonella magna]MBM6912280.1 protein translocase subunit SecF [Veillonella magna]
MRFDVIKHHRWWFSISSLLVVISIVSMFMNGFNLGIDFTGGTIVEVQFDRNVQVSQVRDDLKQFGLENAVIQLSGEASATEGNDIIIRTRNLDANESKAIVDSLNANVAPNEVKRVESVGAVIGSEVTEHALINLAVAFLALAAYISYRFEYKVALSSLAAIFHDLIMVLGVFSFFHLEIDSSFLAAILTVIGYSMNESVVIFDRIRENTHTHKRTDTFADLANASIAQSIHRSCYTLTTVLFACCSLYFFGGDTTKNFALCMIVGFVSGAYSSICVATSLWSIWKSRNRKDARNQVAKKA